MTAEVYLEDVTGCDTCEGGYHFIMRGNALFFHHFIMRGNTVFAMFLCPHVQVCTASTPLSRQVTLLPVTCVCLGGLEGGGVRGGTLLPVAGL